MLLLLGVIVILLLLLGVTVLVGVIVTVGVDAALDTAWCDFIAASDVADFFFSTAAFACLNVLESLTPF